MRWNSYVLASKNDSEELIKNHFSSKEAKRTLFILGKGFDLRMNFVIKRFLELQPNLAIDCLLICFDEGQNSSSQQYSNYVNNNYQELRQLLQNKTLIERNINLWKDEGARKRRIGDREAAALINDYNDIRDYTEIIVDISALPRGIYFSLIGKLIHIIDIKPGNTAPINLIVTVAENAKIDASIKENNLDNDAKFLMGFMGGIKSSSEREEPLIWFPILGEDKESHISLAHSELSPSEVCPVFPFPAKNPRRPDSLLMAYHKLLFDGLKVAPQNIMYVPEQNPFEAYKILVKAVRNYNNSLKLLNGCRAALSTFSSKLLSIGTLLAAYQVNVVDESDIIGVINVDARGYVLENESSLPEWSNESELFLIWLTGIPYED